MQHLAWDYNASNTFRPTVCLISEQRHARLGEMNPDLVRSPGDKVDFYHTDMVHRLKQSVTGFGRLAALCYGHHQVG